MALIVASVALALSYPMVAMVAANEESAFIAELQVEALTTASVLASQPYDHWKETVRTAPRRADERVVVVDLQRRLVADSGGSVLDRGFDRPEIVQALAGNMASDVRYSDTMRTDLRYVAAPVVKDERIVAAVRYSMPEYAVLDAMHRTVRSLALFVVAVTGAAALIAWLIALSISAPVRRLASVAGGLHKDLGLRADEQAGPREIREVAVSLNETATRLRDLVQRTERVAADASHHLRTPLTGIRLRLEAIEDTAQDADTVEHAHRALDEVDRLARRIDQVLALARTDAGGLPMQEVDASQLAQARVEAFAPIASERGIEVTTDIRDGLHARTDIGALPRVLDELLGNALQYARTRIRVSLQQREHTVALVVEDDGTGVRQQEEAAVFDRFTRGQDAVQGGTGLGLAMVRETALACGGDATASRSALGGLAVCVTFPRP